MCDTFVCLPSATADGSVILGKNSDREPNEAHELAFIPAAEFAHDRARATYIEIAQVPHTHALILSKPYWIWGAEMGVNEHGVAIGNEAVFTKAKREKKPGLLGMDLLRLGLERAETADEAVEVITALLARHGQGGQAGHTHRLVYDNSFIVSDRQQAWILETVGRDWAAQRVEKTASISNGLTIGAADRTSTGLRGVTVTERADFLYTRLSDSAARQCRTADSLRAGVGAWMWRQPCACCATTAKWPRTGRRPTVSPVRRSAHMLGSVRSAWHSPRARWSPTSAAAMTLRCG